ncbi:MAG: VOC family protein, partial [Candidatus Thiodiazotropha sp. (ex Lucinoma kastoroae)]|nr:VOC family protein [Candidatus Thiodiazotropha sp. (ex Lucinoma kastoroae)]
MNEHEKLNYVEFSAKNLGATKAFFESAFGW